MKRKMPENALECSIQGTIQQDKVLIVESNETIIPSSMNEKIISIKQMRAFTIRFINTQVVLSNFDKSTIFLYFFLQNCVLLASIFRVFCTAW